MVASSLSATRKPVLSVRSSRSVVSRAAASGWSTTRVCTGPHSIGSRGRLVSVDETWDLVVVGGGPAGSAAALAAKRRRPDARVLLLDRADFPRDKACGDGIAAHGRDELAALGRAGPHRRLHADDQAVGGLPRRRRRLGDRGPAQPRGAAQGLRRPAGRRRPRAGASRCAGTGSGRSPRPAAWWTSTGSGPARSSAADGAGSTVRRLLGDADRPREAHRDRRARVRRPAAGQRAGRRRPVHRDAEAGLAGVRVVVPDRRRHREHRLRHDAAAAARGRAPGQGGAARPAAPRCCPT